MKTIITILILLSSVNSFCQKDTTYYFGVNGKIGLISSELSKKIIHYKSPKRVKVCTFEFEQKRWKNTLTEVYTKIDEGTYLIKSKIGIFKNYEILKYSLNENGTYKFSEYVNDKVKRIGYTKAITPFVLHGKVTEFYADGNIKSESVYNFNELVSNKNWREDGTEYFDNIFYSVDESPSYTLGAKYLQDHILKTLNNYQVDLTSISGEIVIGFVVLEDGHIDGFQVIKGIEKNLNTIALNSFTTLMGRWDPAILNGKQVRYFQTYPINFISKEINFDRIEFSDGIMNWTSN